jgi:hypothetical protein
MTQDDLIRLLKAKRVAQAQFSALYNTDTSSFTDDQAIAHDIATQMACIASVKADDVYAAAIRAYNAESFAQ